MIYIANFAYFIDEIDDKCLACFNEFKPLRLNSYLLYKIDNY